MFTSLDRTFKDHKAPYSVLASTFSWSEQQDPTKSETLEIYSKPGDQRLWVQSAL